MSGGLPIDGEGDINHKYIQMPSLRRKLI